MIYIEPRPISEAIKDFHTISKGPLNIVVNSKNIITLAYIFDVSEVNKGVAMKPHHNKMEIILIETICNIKLNKKLTTQKKSI